MLQKAYFDGLFRNDFIEAFIERLKLRFYTFVEVPINIPLNKLVFIGLGHFYISSVRDQVEYL